MSFGKVALKEIQQSFWKVTFKDIKHVILKGNFKRPFNNVIPKGNLQYNKKGQVTLNNFKYHFDRWL